MSKNIRLSRGQGEMVVPIEFPLHVNEVNFCRLASQIFFISGDPYLCNGMHGLTTPTNSGDGLFVIPWSETGTPFTGGEVSKFNHRLLGLTRSSTSPVTLPQWFSWKSFRSEPRRVAILSGNRSKKIVNNTQVKITLPEPIYWNPDHAQNPPTVPASCDKLAFCIA